MADVDTDEDILIAAMASALVERMDQKLSEAETATLSLKLGVAKGQSTNLDGF